MTAETKPLRFSVLGVNCRHCGLPLEVHVDPEKSVDEQLAECERQSGSHKCNAKEERDDH